MVHMCQKDYGCPNHGLNDDNFEKLPSGEEPILRTHIDTSLDKTPNRTIWSPEIPTDPENPISTPKP